LLDFIVRKTGEGIAVSLKQNLASIWQSGLRGLG
jgi:hypothetical protein